MTSNTTMGTSSTFHSDLRFNFEDVEDVHDSSDYGSDGENEELLGEVEGSDSIEIELESRGDGMNPQAGPSRLPHSLADTHSLINEIS